MKNKKSLLLLSVLCSISLNSCDLIGQPLIDDDSISTNTNIDESTDENKDNQEVDNSENNSDKENKDESKTDDSKDDTSKEEEPKDNNPVEDKPKEDPKDEPKEDPKDEPKEDPKEEEEEEDEDDGTRLVSFYQDDKLITSFRYPSMLGFYDDYVARYSRGAFREPFKIDEEGYRYEFNGWSTSKGASQGYKLFQLPRPTEDTVYYATFKMDQPKKITYYEWNYEGDKYLSEAAFTADELCDMGMIKSYSNYNRVDTFNPKWVEERGSNFGYNLYFNDERFNAIGACTDTFNRGLADCDATNLYMSSIKEVRKKGFSHSKVKNINGINVTTIGESCFEECEATHISLPKLETVSAQAFKKCGSLESINLDSVVTIGAEAFEQCIALKSLHLPSTLTTLEKDQKNNLPFGACINLNELTVDSKNPIFRSENNALISKEDDSLVVATNGTTIIPKSVKIIKSKAFDRCMGLTELTIPSTVETIEKTALSKCYNLTTINYDGTYKELNSKCKGYFGVDGMFKEYGSIYAVSEDYKLTFNCSDGVHVKTDW